MDHSVSAVGFLTGSSGPQNLLVISASGDKSLKLSDTKRATASRHYRATPAGCGRVPFAGRPPPSVSAGSDQTARLWDISPAAGPGNELVVMTGHESGIRCCAFAPAASYEYLASLAGLKKRLTATSTAEFMAPGSPDKTISLWDARGVCFETLVGHENWDLSQDGRCIKVLADAHGQFITCLWWTPDIVKEETEQAREDSGEPQIGCLVATGSVEKVVRIFAK